MDRRIALLVNESAGSGKAKMVSRTISRRLSNDGYAFDEFTDQWPGSFEGYGTILLIGGDGTLNHFVNKYDVEVRNIPILLFKGGTGNDFAWKLHGTLSNESIYAKLNNNKVIHSDVGLLNGYRFINGVGIGFDGSIVKSMKKKYRFTAGHFNYLLQVLSNILYYRECDLELASAEYTGSMDSFMLTVANGSRYGGGFMVSPDSLIDDGVFNVINISSIKPLKRIFYLPKIEKGKHLHLPFVQQFTSSSIKVRCNTTVSAHYDGELLESDMFQIDVSATRLTFIV